MTCPCCQSALFPLLNASDALKRTADILMYVIDKHSHKENPGEGWVLGVIESSIGEVRSLIDTARQALENPTPRND